MNKSRISYDGGYRDDSAKVPALPISGLLVYLDRGVAAGAALARDCCQGCPNTGDQCSTV